MRVLLEVRSEEKAGASLAMTAEATEAPFEVAKLAVAGFEADSDYPAVVVPGVKGTARVEMALTADLQREFSFQPEDVSYLVRGTVPDDKGQEAAVSELLAQPQVEGVYADPVIATALTCGGTPPVGNHNDVAAKLDVPALAAKGLTGSGVRIAIVDTGINQSFLQSKGMSQALDAANSFNPTGVTEAPGAHAPHHGTMCAFDTGIAAPEAEFLDHALLLTQAGGETAMEGLLSDAVRSFSQLRALRLAEPERPLVVNNSWCVFDPAWDFPVGHPGNYTDNPAHPFNLIVAALESAGADIFFAAGNCGRDCPDGRCKFTPQSPQSICGANSHASVSSVAGIDTNDERVGYSSQGPGRLNAEKPDFASYTHFLGSEVFGAGKPDSGTSAACPVAAGVVAAVRSRYSPAEIAPAQMRALIERSAIDLGGSGFDYDHGWGALSGPGLAAALP